MANVGHGKKFEIAKAKLLKSAMKLFLENTKAFWEGKDVPDESILMGSTIGTHAGPGIVAIGFFTK